MVKTTIYYPLSTTSSHSSHPLRQQLTPTAYPKLLIEHLHILMDGMPAKSELGRDLLFAVAVQQMLHDLPQPRLQGGEARVGLLAFGLEGPGHLREAEIDELRLALGERFVPLG